MGYLERTRALCVFVGEEGKDVCDRDKVTRHTLRLYLPPCVVLCPRSIVNVHV